MKLYQALYMSSGVLLSSFMTDLFGLYGGVIDGITIVYLLLTIGGFKLAQVVEEG